MIMGEDRNKNDMKTESFAALVLVKPIGKAGALLHLLFQCVCAICCHVHHHSKMKLQDIQTFPSAGELLYLVGKNTGQSASVLAVLIFIPALKHALENRSKAYWRLLLFEPNNVRSSVNSRRRTLHSPNVTPVLKKVSLSFLSMYIMNRRGERTHPGRSLTLRIKGFVFMPLT